MQTDEQYGHQLGARLHHITEDVRAAPGLAATVKRRQTRRAWTIRTAFAAPIAAAAAAVVAVTLAGPGAQTASPPPPADNVKLTDVAYVKGQVIKAVAKAGDYVVFEREAYSNNHIDTWTDRANQRYRNDSYGPTAAPNNGPKPKKNADGSYTVQAPPAPDPNANQGPVHLLGSSAGSGPIGNRDIVSVNYDDRTYSTYHDDTTFPPSDIPDPTDPATIDAAVNNGTVTVIGEETVNGVAALHLQILAARGYLMDLWVDKVTFLTVRETASVPDQSGPPVLDNTFTWLPRTNENLAHLTLTPPPGFTKIPG